MLEGLAEEIGRLVEKHFPSQAEPGCAAIVAIEGQPVYTRCVGVRDIRTGEAITERTNFRMASVSKQFTAAATVTLVVDGKLRMDETLCEIFPDFPKWGADIAVRHLIGHTSGLPNYEDHLPEGLAEPIFDRHVLQIMTERPAPLFPAGTKYAYSNSGYALLAMIVEAKAGCDYGSYMRDRFFLPLGMTQSVIHVEGRTEVAERSFGHRRNPEGQWYSRDGSLTSAVLGDGGVYTSITDYTKWAHAYMTDKVLPAAWKERAWKNGRLNDGTMTEYGLGFRVGEVKGLKVVHHTGSTTGFNTFARWVPERRLCVAVFSNGNSDGPKMLAPEIEDVILDMLRERSSSSAAVKRHHV